MAAKKYRAKTIQEAIRIIKEEIGPDALILSTKRIPRGAGDPYGKDMFEVEAVAGDSGGRLPPARPRAESGAATGEAMEAVRNFASALGAMRGASGENPGHGRVPGPGHDPSGRGAGRNPVTDSGHAGRTAEPPPRLRESDYPLREGSVGGTPGAPGINPGMNTDHGRARGSDYLPGNGTPAGIGYGADGDFARGGTASSTGGERRGMNETRAANYGDPPPNRGGGVPPGTGEPRGGRGASGKGALAGESVSSGDRFRDRSTSAPGRPLENEDTDISGLGKLLGGEAGGGGGPADIRTELTSIKEMLFLMGRGDGLPALAAEHPEALPLYARLVKLGISEKRAQLLVGEACEKSGGGKEEITAAVLKRILGTFETSAPFDEIPPKAGAKRYVAAFVGPTGVGKTTTIAKLAAELSLKRKRKVGLISVDSYRIGALEQLKTYAAIMGLPCLPAFNREDLREALDKMKGREIILIDTAGHSHLDGKRMGELGELMGGERSISVHLVLSVTSGRANMKEAAENFGVLNPESYVFTKVDETKIRGTVIEQVMDRALPISYITNGQRVPEDLVAATKRDVLRFILN